MIVGAGAGNSSGADVDTPAPVTTRIASSAACIDPFLRSFPSLASFSLASFSLAPGHQAKRHATRRAGGQMAPATSHEEDRPGTDGGSIPIPTAITFPPNRSSSTSVVRLAGIGRPDQLAARAPGTRSRRPDRCVWSTERVRTLRNRRGSGQPGSVSLWQAVQMGETLCKTRREPATP